MERLIDGSFLEDRCKRQKSDEWNKKAAPSSWVDAIKGVTWKCVPYIPEPPKEEKP